MTEDQTGNICGSPSSNMSSCDWALVKFLLPSKSISIVTDTRPEEEDEESEVTELSAKQALSSSTAHPVSSVSQPILNIDCLSIKCDLVGGARVNVELSRTEG